MATLNVIFPIDTSFPKNQILKSFNCLLALKADNITVFAIYRTPNDLIELGLDKISNSRIKFVQSGFSNYLQAFNYGIKIANADFIGFLTPGDYVSSSYVYTTRMTHNVDIISFQTDLEKNGFRFLRNLSEIDTEGMYNVSKVLPKSIKYVYNKVYKTSILKNVSFSENLLFEDALHLFNVEVLLKSNTFMALGKTTTVHTVSKEASLSDEEKVKYSNNFLKKINVLLSLTEQVTILNYLTDLKKTVQNFILYENIDFVFPYVTSDDVSWQEEYKKALIEDGRGDCWATGIERFRDSGMLKYTFRALEKNLPWLHKVHMLVMAESQVPAWINRENVNVIVHKDFIPENLLPTFNSSTIEMFLPKLKGVSNTFIYGNDDTLFTRPLEPTFFFDGGKPIYQVVLRNFYETAPGDIMRRNDYNLYFNTDQTKRVVTTQHGPIPYKMAWIKECYKKFEKEMIASCTKFRTETDLNQYLFALYQMMEKEIVNTKRNYVTGILTPRFLEKIKSLDFSSIDEICINDTDSTTPEQWSQLLEKLNTEFPNKCKYEV